MMVDQSPMALVGSSLRKPSNGSVAFSVDRACPLEPTMILITILLAGNVAQASAFSLVAMVTD